MKRLLTTIAIAGIALSAVPAHADEPSVTSRVRDTGQVFGWFPMPNGHADIYLNYQRTTTPAPSVDPGSIFPITIDPNDPPETPANAVTESLTLQGWISTCDWNIGCWSAYLTEASVPEGFLSFDDAPLPGNAITVSGTLSLEDGPFPLDVTIQIRGARPDVTRLWTDNTVLHPNVWVDGSDAHAGTDTYAPLITRHTYSASGSVSSALGTVPAQSAGFDFNRSVEAFTSVDATVPA